MGRGSLNETDPSNGVILTSLLTSVCLVCCTPSFANTDQSNSKTSWNSFNLSGGWGGSIMSPLNSSHSYVGIIFTVFSNSVTFVLSLDHVFLCFAPSRVAAACVAASRLILHLSPTWAPRLQQLTGYSWENLVPCAEKLLMCVYDNFLNSHQTL